MKALTRLALPTLIALLCAATMAQPKPPEKPNNGKKALVIRGGDLYTISDGVIRNGTVLIEDGKITQIGTNVTLPEGAEVIDASGRTVMPGLVAANISGMVSGSAKEIADGLDPYGTVVSFALASGITAAYVQAGSAGSSGTGGTNAIVKMAEGDLKSMLVREPVAVNVSYSRSSPSTKAALRKKLQDTVDYLREKEQYEADKAAGKKVEEPKKPSDADTMTKLLAGQLPARLSASSSNDILNALELADEFGIRLILDGVVEGWTVAEEMGKYDVDAVITPRTIWGTNTDVNAPTGSNDRLAAILKAAGVRFAVIPASAGFSTGGGFGDDLFTLPYEAAHAVGGGLDEQTALESITLTPAQMFGVDDRIGSLEVGKDADIIILDGHPFHYSSFVEFTLVNGKILYDKSKATYFSHIRPRAPDPEAPTEDGAEETETPPPQE